MLSAVEAEGRRELLLIDIRPVAERRSELGFIPGSLSAPFPPQRDGLEAWLDAIGPSSGLVLCCTSGRRSAAAWDALAGRVEVPLFHLIGGQLSWEASGLPMCRVDEPESDPPSDLIALRRHLIACFIAENAEVALDHEDAQSDPYEMLQRCFQQERVPWEQPTVEGFFRVLDRAAAATRQAGGDTARIAANLGAMYALLGALERRAG